VQHHDVDDAAPAWHVDIAIEGDLFVLEQWVEAMLIGAAAAGAAYGLVEPLSHAACGPPVSVAAPGM
jgi:hypothetical protein